MKSTRCEEVIVTLIVRSYDDLGRPIGEVTVGQANGSGGVAPLKVFRNAETRDFWGWVDQAVAAMEKPSAPTVAPPAAPPAPVPPKKPRGRG